VGNVYISASDVCVIEGHGLFKVRLIGRTMGIGRAFFGWAVFQEADQLNIFNNGLELIQVSGAIGCGFHFLSCNEIGMYTHALLFELTTTTPESLCRLQFMHLASGFWGWQPK
jgi:hypothetical protein